MDIATVFVSGCGAIVALSQAFSIYMQFRLQRLTLDSKRISEGNASALAHVSQLGRDNADAIEHTRVQNVRIASAVEVTKTQNEEIAEAVGHVHICVETRVAELKEAVKEVVPAAIMEAVPEVVAGLK